MHDEVELQEAAQRLLRDWYLVLVAGIPVVCIALLVIGRFIEEPLDLGYAVELSPRVFWIVAAVLMTLAFLGAGIVGGTRLHPRALADRGSSTDAASAGAVELAEARIREVTFMQLGILDFPAIVLLLYGLVANDDIALVLAIGYCLAAFVLMKPDTKRLLRETVLHLDAGIRLDRRSDL